MASSSNKPSFPVPTIDFKSCPNAKIYVNTIINTPHPDCPSNLTVAVASPVNRGDKNPKPEEKHFVINPDTGGRVIIFYGSTEKSSPSITVEISKLSSKENSETKSMPAYVITVNTNNVFGEEAVAVVSETEGHPTINAENVILSSSGPINVGPGAGGHNAGLAAGGNNSVTIVENLPPQRRIPITDSKGQRKIPTK